MIKTDLKEKKSNPWSWVPTLYFSEGLPFFVVTILSVIMYKRLGVSNAEIAFYTSLLYLPWVIKPFWSPLVDIVSTKRSWIIITQLLIGFGMAGIAFTIQMPDFLQFTLAFFWLIAFFSATNEISADGFYMLALDDNKQAFFVGIKTASYKIAMIAGQGLIIVLAGFLESTFSISPAEFNVVSSPKNFFEETIKLNSEKPAELEGRLRIIAEPSKIEIGTQPRTLEDVEGYVNFARSFNIMNGYSDPLAVETEMASSQEAVGNIGIVRLFLSKKPEPGEEYPVTIDFLEGNNRIRIIEGNKLKFTDKNWDKPAFAVVQLDSTMHSNENSVFIAQIEKVPIAWTLTFLLIAFLFILFFLYHKVVLPEPVADKRVGSQRQTHVHQEFFRSFYRFFEKKKIILIISFILLFSFGEAQLIKIASPFMLDSIDKGGLGLSTQSVGLIHGTFGITAFIVGAIIGGFAIAKKGLKHWLIPMLVAVNAPNIVYLLLSIFQLTNMWIVIASVIIEQFGFGFGFTAFIMYIIYICQGEYKTSHYAIATGFMALGMMLPGMLSGFIQEAIGYNLFFIWVLVSAIPAFLLVKRIPLEGNFGKKKIDLVNS
ncbi:MAG: MFS transporter [Melioribacteraceae bacterium]|nr:MFS transporter [Melioribacteraceae bacterium]